MDKRKGERARREKQRDRKSKGNKWIIKGECGGRSASDWKEGGDVCGAVSGGKMQCALPQGGYLPPTACRVYTHQ